MKAQERMYLNADRSKLVGEGDDKAAFLYASIGDEIPDSAAEKFGLRDGKLPAKKSAPPPPAPPPAPKAPVKKAAAKKPAAKKAAAKGGAPSADKEQAPVEDKEQAPSENKGGGSTAGAGDSPNEKVE